ncbi:uncharacterized protein LY89DRAFT_587813 [Mollisia scopiformis]|uniref:DUF7727 domain-containing protein n=1 Tax=Mollisia scopiformis TaxID=149040 RepID=A0A194X4W3_MOLSC|nr:uncharacterized protein LY89DRAFT_587813 [Mollisia scopiformis]KUJ15215.1 hypothetical protein LY89DRAFT_587813 [Mollisia scopiformis]
MARLIKMHLARLIVLSAATYQIAAALEGFFWPKIFWDFMTDNLNGLVKPVPALQMINLLFGIGIIVLELPLGVIANTWLQRSVRFRVFILILSSFASVLLYQGTDPAIYHLIGASLYLWAHYTGEKMSFLAENVTEDTS